MYHVLVNNNEAVLCFEREKFFASEKMSESTYAKKIVDDDMEIIAQWTDRYEYKLLEST